MKKNLFMLGLIMLSTIVEATSLHPDTFKGVRLSYTFGPYYDLHHMPVGASNGVIEVRTNGDAVYYAPGALVRPDLRRSKIIRRFNAYEMDRIERLIDRAATVAPVTPEVQCAGIPTETRGYSADGYNVILLSGGFDCAIEKENQSKAAIKLVRILDQLRKLAQK